MFKKRGNAKKVDLNEEAQHIHVALPIERPVKVIPEQIDANSSDEKKQPNQQPLMHKTETFKLQQRANFLSIETLEKEEGLPQRNILIKETVNEAEIQQCFAQINKFKMYIQQPLTVYSYYEPMQSVFLIDKAIQITGEQDAHQQVYEQVLDVEEDYMGGFSPVQQSQDDMVNEDYQDMLIRKTLTKQNYQRVRDYGGAQSLNSLKKQKAKSDLLTSIRNASSQAIKRTISRDLHNKRLKMKQLQEQFGYIATRTNEKEADIKQKQDKLQRLQSEFVTVNKLLEFIYFHGEKILHFDMKAILKQVEEREQPAVYEE